MRDLMMKKIYILLLISFCVSVLFAQDAVTTFSPKLHEIYGLDLSMSIATISDTLSIPVEEIMAHFQLNVRDPNLANLSLRRHNINIDDVYQFYNLRNFGFNDNSTLDEASRFLQIPFIKIAEYLNLDAQDSENRSRTLRDLHIETIDMLEFKERFDSEMMGLSAVLTILGMLASLLALTITALAISQLTHLKGKTKEAEPKPITITTPVGKITPATSENISSDAIVAVIATIHKLNIEIEKENKIFTTLRRANISMWHASGKVNMSTQQYFALRNNRR